MFWLSKIKPALIILTHQSLMSCSYDIAKQFDRLLKNVLLNK